MDRRFVIIELGEHAHTHILPRLHKVIDGIDQGGISQAVGWKGGGGFRYYKLAPSLLTQDKWGQWVINKDYNPAMLAEAVCKHEGFLYAPSDTEYWNHGHSTERDFIYVTTQTLTQEQLAKAAGISTRSLKRYESAERDVSLSVLKRIERELDARISDVRPLGDSEDSAADGVVLDPAEGDAVELTRQLRTAIDTLSEQGQHVLLALALTILRQEGTRNP